ncbi:MAG TPA: hypothetical protein VKY90_12275 [Candidatus Dormibacteraeota bacterium]|nr:hypothetical protein [Candidatus Dormibacteraeota bacterium]
MNEAWTRAPGGSVSFARFGLSRAALQAAITAELEQAEDSRDPAVIASAVAAAIEANNRELLRQLNQVWTLVDTSPMVRADEGSSED